MLIKKSNEEIKLEILKRSYVSSMSSFVDEDVFEIKKTIDKLIDGGCEIFDFPLPAGLAWHLELTDGGDLFLKSRPIVCQDRQTNSSLFEDLKSTRLAIFAITDKFLRFVILGEREFTDSSFKVDSSPGGFIELIKVLDV